MADNETQETSAGSTTTVDLNSPLVQAAIQKAVQDAARKVHAERDEGEQRLKGHSEKLLGEKKRLQEELESLRTKAEAAEHGVDATKLEELAEKKAQTKAEMYRRELADSIKEAQESAAKEAKEAATLKKLLHRARVESLMAREEGIVPGAFNILADSVERIVTFQHVDGVDVPILQHNGETIQGTVADLLKLAREGKGPIADRTFCFASNGKGSGTTSTNGAGPVTKNVYKMTSAEVAAYTKEHGLEAFKQLMNDTPLPEVTAATR